MTIRDDLDARIACVERAGLTPVSLILSYADHRILSYELGGPGVGYPRTHAYSSFAPSYRGLRIVRPGIAYDGAPSVGVREG